MLDRVVDLGFNILVEAGKEKYAGIRDQKALRTAVTNYLRQHSKFNRCVNLAEEIDFDGLVEYCKSETFKRLAYQRICGTDSERKRARASIEEQAYEYAHTKEKKGEQKVVGLITGLTDLIQDFYKRKVPPEIKTLAAQSVDEINENTNARANELKKKFEEIESSISREEKMKTAFKEGRYSDAERLVNEHVNFSQDHPLKGYYGTELRLVGDKLKFKSVPLTPDALEKYPPNIKVTGKFRIHGKEYDTLTRDMLDASWRHQEPFYLSISEAEQYLGDFRDPGQISAESLTGKEVEIVPPPLSQIVPCEIYCDEECFYRNVEFRVDEITDDGTMIISNRKQINPDIIITLYLREESLMNASVGIRDANLSQLLQFRKFIKHSKDKEKTRIVADESGRTVAQWISNSIDIKTIFDSIEEDLDFLERLLLIEEYLHREIKAEKVTYEDYTTVHYVSDLLRGENKTGSWETFDVTDKVSDELRTLIGNSNKGEFITIFGSTRFVHDLFGEEIEIPIYRFYNGARIVDFERKCKQIEYSDEGDQIILRFEPTSDHGIVTDIFEPFAFNDLDPAARDELMKGRSMIFVHEQDADEQETEQQDDSATESNVREEHEP